MLSCEASIQVPLDETYQGISEIHQPSVIQREPALPEDLRLLQKERAEGDADELMSHHGVTVPA